MPGRVVAKGVLVVNDELRKSSWLDMFRAEEIGGMGRLDLSKIQMFYFTVIIVFAYATALSDLLANASEKITSFPALSPSVIGLLGISHATYLASKSIGGGTATE
jgi:hypothetical protein